MLILLFGEREKVQLAGFGAADKTKSFRLLLFSNEGKVIAALQTVQLSVCTNQHVKLDVQR